MPFLCYIVLVLLSGLNPLTPYSQGQSAVEMAKDLESIRFNAIKNLNIRTENGMRMADFVVEMVNRGTYEVVIAEGALYRTIEFKREDGEGSKVVLGPAAPAAEQVLAPGGMLKGSQNDLKLVMRIGPAGEPETEQKLIDLINLLGQPNNALKISLTGTAQVGIKPKSGQTTAFAERMLRFEFVTEKKDKLVFGK
jgi:hypothetical protein